MKGIVLLLVLVAMQMAALNADSFYDTSANSDCNDMMKTVGRGMTIDVCMRRCTLLAHCYNGAFTAATGECRLKFRDCSSTKAAVGTTFFKKKNQFKCYLCHGTQQSCTVAGANARECTSFTGCTVYQTAGLWTQTCGSSIQAGAKNCQGDYCNFLDAVQSRKATNTAGFTYADMQRRHAVIHRRVAGGRKMVNELEETGQSSNKPAWMNAAPAAGGWKPAAGGWGAAAKPAWGAKPMFG